MADDLNPSPEVLQILNGAPPAAPGGSAAPQSSDTQPSPDVLSILNSDPNAAPSAQPGPAASSDQQRSDDYYGKLSQGEDIGMSALSAVPKGLIKLLGFPAAAAAWLKHLSDVYDRVPAKGDSLLERGAPGALDVLNRTPAAVTAATGVPTTSSGLTDALENYTGAPMYQPQSQTARYIAAPIEGAASMPFAPGLGVASGLGGEAGKQIAGPWGELIGSLVGAGGAGLMKMAISSPESLIRTTLENVSEEDLTKAQQLMDTAKAARTPITGPEALAQVIGPNRLNALQRVLESKSAELQGMMADRPEANIEATQATLAKTGPLAANPSEIAPKVQASAKQTVDQARQQINDWTAPLYQSSAATQIPDAAFSALTADPKTGAIVADALKQVRSDPVYGGLKGMPDNSVTVLDAVQKRLGRTADVMQRQGDTAGAGSYLEAKDAVQGAAATADADYAHAIGYQAQQRAAVLDPLQRSPTGQLAATDQLKQQGDILFGPKPLAGSENEVRQTMRDLVARDPGAAQELTREYLERAFNETARQLASGPNQFGGAAYAASLFGNAQRAKNLLEAVKQLPNGEDAANSFLNLMRIFQAQGQRFRAGSQTAFAQADFDALSKGGTVGEIFRQAGQPGSFVKNMATSAYANMNASKLAGIFTDPKSVDLMRKIAKIDPHSNAAKAFFGMLIAGDQPVTETKQ